MLCDMLGDGGGRMGLYETGAEAGCNRARRDVAGCVVALREETDMEDGTECSMAFQERRWRGDRSGIAENGEGERRHFGRRCEQAGRKRMCGRWYKSMQHGACTVGDGARCSVSW